MEPLARSVFELAWQGRSKWLARIAVTLAICAAIEPTTAYATRAESQTQAAIADQQLIVLFDPTNVNSPLATEIVDAVKRVTQRPELLTQLGLPNDAGRVLEHVTSPQYRAQLLQTRLARRALLEEYVLLTYPSIELARVAKALLDHDPRLLSVEPNRLLSLSVLPNDRYLAQDPNNPGAGNYQWGMQLLNMPAAWDRERGIAYVAAVDAGIDCGGSNPCSQSTLHPDLKQNTRLHFSKNFYLSGSTVITDANISQCSGNPCSAVHGTHVSGIIAATPDYGAYMNGTSNSGVAGACWTCSFSMLRIADFYDATIGAAITYAVDHGAQAINMSFGDQYASPRYSSCGGNYSFQCVALGHASDYDVSTVAAAGNGYENRIQYPALKATVVAVGGVEVGGGFFRNGYGNGNTCTPGIAGNECGSNYGVQDDGTSPLIAAPAKDVISTVYRAHDHNTNAHCGNSFGPDSVAHDGYGDCTGTSMSAPHVTGLVGLIRSADPLLTYAQVKSILLANTASCSGTDSAKCGNGIPNASQAMSASFGGPNVKNRLTPLFSFYSSVASDHLYTIVPQMANAALNSGQLIPQPPSASISYAPIGNATPGYSQFPTPPNCFSPCPSTQTPSAMVSVFTSYVDPTSASAELVPLYRMSWSCSGSCSHVSHVYTTSSSGLSAFQSVGYVLDGIEGYIYPSTTAQPSGTVKLCRKYSATDDDYILFAGTGTNGATCGNGDGFTKDSNGNVRTDYTGTPGGTDWIGWVYTVRAPEATCAGGIPCAVTAALIPILSDD